MFKFQTVWWAHTQFIQAINIICLWSHASTLSLHKSVDHTFMIHKPYMHGRLISLPLMFNLDVSYVRNKKHV